MLVRSDRLGDLDVDDAKVLMFPEGLVGFPADTRVVHIREAITQLRGEAGERQVPGAKTAFLTPGGFFFNAQGLVLHTA